MQTKKWWQSNTIQLAILQAVVGVIAAVQLEYPAIGILSIIKSTFDIIIRLKTSQPIS